MLKEDYSRVSQRHWVEMKLFYLLCLAVPVLEAAQLCQPDAHGVRRYNGKPCASTTRYVDGHKGACGCGPKGTDTPFPWNLQLHVTAPSERYFDLGGSSLWCGRRCGYCVRLTPTGGFVPGKGSSPPNHNPVVFMVTNACPINGNEEWCGINGAPGTGHVNSHGYEVHFDLQDQVGQIEALHWDNPEVTWEEVPCPADMNSHYRECECPKNSESVNTYGYEVHFDLQNQAGQIDKIYWNNPEVTWEEVTCPSNYKSLWLQCECSRSSVPLLEAAQLCQKDAHGVRRFNGKPCASTTRYVDGHKGACGCGQTGTDNPFPWNVQQHVTAPSERYFDNGGSINYSR